MDDPDRQIEDDLLLSSSDSSRSPSPARNVSIHDNAGTSGIQPPVKKNKILSTSKSTSNTSKRTSTRIKAKKDKQPPPQTPQRVLRGRPKSKSKNNPSHEFSEAQPSNEDATIPSQPITG